ncbi:hypothetical protein BT93_L4292 [Corymbia citriodora subsp. variegata]|uniref:Uncharacterized protein n=1 Tax=Corymbia citriodora subsp. variegata TaxID=360336 RepID=A0A8T0CUG1_CORYI|nr:hypothetical protein BT93_L4292 [Corymbia citriodora subsp. variegata]
MKERKKSSLSILGRDVPPVAPPFTTPSPPLVLYLRLKELEISRIQESIAKAKEEKISGEQRRYLLNEQLKAIKKVTPS